MDTESKIFDAAFNLFMKYGIKSVSMDDIAKHIGISKKTIYNLVENKKQLVHQVVSQFISQEEKDVTKIMQDSTDAIDEMLNIGRYWIKFLREMKPTMVFDLQKYHPSVWRLVETDHFKFIGQVVKANLIKGQNSKFYREEINPDIITQLYMAKSNTLANEEIFPNQEYPKPDLFEQFFIYHLYGVASEKGRKHLNAKISIS
jgi:AcrR family transcriptional regulator